MKITELQKELQKIYEKYGNIEVLIQNGSDRFHYEGQRKIHNVKSKAELFNTIVILS